MARSRLGNTMQLPDARKTHENAVVPPAHRLIAWMTSSRLDVPGPEARVTEAAPARSRVRFTIVDSLPLTQRPLARHRGLGWQVLNCYFIRLSVALCRCVNHHTRRNEPVLPILSKLSPSANSSAYSHIVIGTINFNNDSKVEHYFKLTL